MTFNTFIENCLMLVKNNPKLAELPVISSSDDEGNSFKKIIFTPTLMKVDDIEDKFMDAEEADEDDCNAICIN